MHTKTTTPAPETAAPEATWPTVPIRLSRPNEPQDSLFARIERHCPMARGQRCLVLAPGHEAVSAFLAELRERIVSLNPDVEARLLQIAAGDPAPDVDALVGAAQSALRQGRHSVLILDSLNALAARHADSVQACKRLFGAARATRNGGTVTIVTLAHEPALAETDIEVLRTFQGTGNMELTLRLGPARHALSLDESRSGTKHAERVKSARYPRRQADRGPTIGIEGHGH